MSNCKQARMTGSDTELLPLIMMCINLIRAAMKCAFQVGYGNPCQCLPGTNTSRHTVVQHSPSFLSFPPSLPLLFTTLPPFLLQSTSQLPTYLSVWSTVPTPLMTHTLLPAAMWKFSTMAHGGQCVTTVGGQRMPTLYAGSWVRVCMILFVFGNLCPV